MSEGEQDYKKHISQLYNGAAPTYDRVGTPTLFDAVQLEEILSNAGFVNIAVVSEEEEFHYRDAEEWWAAEWSCGNRALFERMEPSALGKFREEAVEVIQGFREENGIPILFHMLLARASKP